MTDDADRPGPDARGCLPANILMFCRTLRAGGLPVGPGQVIDALLAARTTGIERPDDLYAALRATLVTDSRHFPLFHQTFLIWFRRPGLLTRLTKFALAEDEGTRDSKADAAVRRLMEAISPPHERLSSENRVEADRSESWSRREILRRKDFEQMTLAELGEAKLLLRAELEPLRPVPTRRYRQSVQGGRYDLRRSMQNMVRMNGQLMQLAKKRRAERSPPLVLICDISGSMSKYSRIFLHFAHAVSSRHNRVHTFVFGTRLTNISHRLREKDVDAALAQVSAEVQDWDGGTRIAESLRRFNIDWNRRVLAQNAVVILLSDGLERESGSSLGFQMQRLHASCRQLLWLNPVLRYRHFEPRAEGIRKMLPHVDRFLPAHNIESLSNLVQILGRQDGPPRRAAWQATPSGEANR